MSHHIPEGENTQDRTNKRFRSEIVLVFDTPPPPKKKGIEIERSGKVISLPTITVQSVYFITKFEVVGKLGKCVIYTSSYISSGGEEYRKVYNIYLTHFSTSKQFLNMSDPAFDIYGILVTSILFYFPFRRGGKMHNLYIFSEKYTIHLNSLAPQTVSKHILMDCALIGDVGDFNSVLFSLPSLSVICVI